MACNSSDEEKAQKSKRRLGRKLNGRPFINFRIAHLELIAKNDFVREFCKYL